MTVKLFEVRDVGQQIPMMAVTFDAGEDPLFAIAGFRDGPFTLLINLKTHECQVDAYGWGNRTCHAAHRAVTEGLHDKRGGVSKSAPLIDVPTVLESLAVAQVSRKGTPDA